MSYLKRMRNNPHCFGAACDSHSFGRKRRGGRGSFLTSLADAGFGIAIPFIAVGASGYIYNFRSGGGQTGPRIVAKVTDSLWQYTTPSNWTLGNPTTNWDKGSPYRMQDVPLWWKARYNSQNFCETNSMCRELVGPQGVLRAMPWSYVATVQPGGKISRRTRRGMVNFLRDYAKYVRAQQSTGGIPYGDLGLIGTGLQQPQPSPYGRSTRGLDPFQRKMQRNTFKAKRNRR